MKSIRSLRQRETSKHWQPKWLQSLSQRSSSWWGEWKMDTKACYFLVPNLFTCFLTQTVFSGLHLVTKSPFWMLVHTISKDFLANHSLKNCTLFLFQSSSGQNRNNHYSAFDKVSLYNAHGSRKAGNFPIWWP